MFVLSTVFQMLRLQYNDERWTKCSLGLQGFLLLLQLLTAVGGNRNQSEFSRWDEEFPYQLAFYINVKLGIC